MRNPIVHQAVKVFTLFEKIWKIIIEIKMKLEIVAVTLAVACLATAVTGQQYQFEAVAPVDYSAYQPESFLTTDQGLILILIFRKKEWIARNLNLNAF